VSQLSAVIHQNCKNSYIRIVYFDVLLFRELTRYIKYIQRSTHALWIYGRSFIA